MITKQLIDQIEGEATLYFEMKENIVDFATIAFPHFRGMESILEGKPALDALVITPRVCGICGHAHLLATVRAIEDAYKNAGYPVNITEKSEQIRELTLILEIIQNHFKWIYLVIIPELIKLSGSQKQAYPLKGAFAASIATKALAIFAGQWPHSSYMIPGGITSDPSHVERIKAKSHIQELITFFEKECIKGMKLEEFLNLTACGEFDKIEGDIGMVSRTMKEVKLHEVGKSYDRFIVLGEHSFSYPSKLKQTRQFAVQAKYVSIQDAYSPSEKTYAKNALYRDMFYETGPLARTMASGDAAIKNMHRRYKDSTYSRVMARAFELGKLLHKAEKLVTQLDLSQDSFVNPMPIEKISAKGVGVVEAPRGPLLHTIEIVEGRIHNYEIITPTQWNIGSATKENPTPVQKAMKGCSSKAEALFVFRSFDVCSVCTTH